MPRINLLPWREQQRTDRKKAFGVGLGAAAIAALALTGLGWVFFSQLIDGQQSRNVRLRGEIKELDKQIEQINNLETEKQQMIARMQIIEKLQLSRSEIVHVFDTYTKVITDGIYLTSLKQTDQKFQIHGISQSPSRVSDFFKAIDGSEWLRDADIGDVNEIDAGKDKALGYDFVLTAMQRVSAADEAEAAKAKDKRKTP